MGPRSLKEMTSRITSLLGALLLSTAACGSEGSPGGGSETSGGAAPPPVTSAETFGTQHSGSYHIGPVDFAETQWHNACAPYAEKIQGLYGPYLAGVDNSLGGDGGLCDACALITTGLGEQIVVHIVTYGVSKAPGDMDLSPEAYEQIHEDDPQGTPENPRPMTWKLARCPDAGSMFLQYQTEANPYWTSLWVRNGKLPIAKVEVKGQRDAGFSELTHTPDGPFTDNNGFGDGAFDLRVTGADDQVVTQSFSGFEKGALVESAMQFK
jgi:expansin (peptidoglycan-binding protein)